jgi:GNAT superfamily N-acetyltransferase
VSSIQPPPPPTVRRALPADLDSIVEFNLRLAEESEGIQLNPSLLRTGAELALTTGDRIQYWVAQDPSGPLLGQAGITLEWSDWRNGWIWWLQSVYVIPPARGRGVFRAMMQAIEQAALAQGDVVGLRLYVEQQNVRAQSVYHACGLKPGGYLVMERFWTGSTKHP